MKGLMISSFRLQRLKKIDIGSKCVTFLPLIHVITSMKLELVQEKFMEFLSYSSQEILEDHPKNSVNYIYIWNLWLLS